MSLSLYCVQVLINSDSTSSGSGKSYIATALVKLLNSQKYMYNAVQVSLDDFYLGHNKRALLRERNPGNGKGIQAMNYSRLEGSRERTMRTWRWNSLVSSALLRSRASRGSGSLYSKRVCSTGMGIACHGRSGRVSADYSISWLSRDSAWVSRRF